MLHAQTPGGELGANTARGARIVFVEVFAACGAMTPWPEAARGSASATCDSSCRSAPVAVSFTALPYELERLGPRCRLATPSEHPQDCI